MLFLVISHLKVVQYYHLVSFKFSAARVWQGADCGGAFSRPGIRQDGKILRTLSPPLPHVLREKCYLTNRKSSF